MLWWGCIWLFFFLNGSAGEEDYVDFMDMGSYQHHSNSHNNDVPRMATTTPTPSTSLSNDRDPSASGTTYLKRLVASLLTQMNVRSHIFGPGEAITLDLQAEICYEDMVKLNEFLTGGNPEAYFSRIDHIFSKMIKVVPPLGAPGVFEFDSEKFEIFYSAKFWLVFFTVAVILFLVLTLSAKTATARSPLQMLFYAFLIIFIVSCVWTYVNMYESAKATNFAKMVQSPSVPKDCDYDNLSYFQTLSYLMRSWWNGKDGCIEYYQNTMKDPLWSVSPVEALSQCFATLIFSPLKYVGVQLGAFFAGVVTGVPFWMQPMLVFLIFFFLFFGIFGYTFRTPFLSIEPASRAYERQERRLVPVLTRDVATDTSDLDSTCNPPPRRRRHAIVNAAHSLWDSVIAVGDILLRQCPTELPDNTLHHHEEASWHENENYFPVVQPQHQQQAVVESVQQRRHDHAHNNYLNVQHVRNAAEQEDDDDDDDMYEDSLEEEQENDLQHLGAAAAAVRLKDHPQQEEMVMVQRVGGASVAGHHHHVLRERNVPEREVAFDYERVIAAELSDCRNECKIK